MQTVPRSHARAALASLVAALGACAPAVDATGPTLPPGTPVVLVVIDTLRADHLSCYGYELETSPVLDRLAAQGHLFEANTAQVNSTFPSITSILTGLYARTHRNYLAVPVEGRVQANRGARSLAERLGDAGYARLAAVSHPGWTRDEKNLEWYATNLHGAMLRGWDGLSMISAEIPIDERSLAGNAGYTNERLFALLDRYERELSDRPLLLWAHYFDPHTDLFPFVYYPPPAYRNLFLREHLAAVGEEALYHELAAVDPAERHTFLAARLAGEGPRLRRVTVANGRALYDAEVRYCDEQLGRLFARLEAMGLWERALVVVMADHGENLEGPEVDRPTHTFTHEKLYEGVVRTPLIVRLPGGSAARRVAGLTQNIDVLPTLLELLGLAVDPPVEGRSLVPALRDAGARIHDEVYAEASDDPELTVKTESLKLIRTEGDEARTSQVFRWREDPLELQDVAAELPPRALARLEESVDGFRPRDALRVRLFPGDAPYTVSFHVELTQGRFDGVVAPGAPEIAADGRAFAHRLRVTDELVDVLLFVNRRNVQTIWTVRRSDGPAHERLWLGRVPIAATSALPIWTPGDGPAPDPAPVLLSHDAAGGRLTVALDTTDVERVELDVRYSLIDYVKAVEVLHAEGFDPEVRREGAVFHVLHRGAPRARVELALNAPDSFVSLRLDGRWPDPRRLALGERAVALDTLRFVIPFPLDKRLISAMVVRAEPGDLPAGAMSIGYDSAGGGGQLDTAGMDEALVEQLRSLGYVR